MCTLTYLLHDDGYELFFNRDEQRARSLAISPQINAQKNAIYPIDPQGRGTWIAVSKKGLSLALLNNYQAPLKQSKNMISRGQLILSLLDLEGDIVEYLQRIDLGCYQPFQLCVFPEGLSLANKKVMSVKWDGNRLFCTDTNLPITSSSVDFPEVLNKRTAQFIRLVDKHGPSVGQHKNYHLSTDVNGKSSVNMSREDAQTVSISHVSVGDNTRFHYFDNVSKEEYTTIFPL